MTDGNDEAFGHGSSNGHCPGLTKREYFAAMAMQALVSNQSAWDEINGKVDEISKERPDLYKAGEGVCWMVTSMSVQLADALIEALNK